MEENKKWKREVQINWITRERKKIKKREEPKGHGEGGERGGHRRAKEYEGGR